MFLGLGAMLLLFGSAGINHAYVQKNAHSSQSLLYFPNAKALRAYSLGYDHAMADLLWMQTLSYFGEHFAGDKNYTYLAHMLDVITQMNPRYKPAYYMAAALLPWMQHDIRESNALMARAMAYFPKDGRWPYYMGLNAFLFGNDKITAAHYLDISLRRGFVNSMSTSLAIKLKAATSNMEMARTYLLGMLKRKQDKNMHNFLLGQLKQVETEIVLRKLDALIRKLKAKGHPIGSIRDLLALGYRIPDRLPDGGKPRIAKNGKTYSTRHPTRYTLHTSKRRAQYKAGHAE